ncbi:MAG TPA: hypothetical protein VG965_07070 [Patescibacteria group bacterium]|nr:hypothetical protein [Patescibacteria group bacterium]
MIRNLVYLTLFTSLIILSWIGFSIYHNYTTSTIDSDTKILITPIPGRFDDEVIQSIMQRKVIDADLNQRTPVASDEASISPTPTPIKLSPTLNPTLSPTPILAQPNISSGSAGL